MEDIDKIIEDLGKEAFLIVASSLLVGEIVPRALARIAQKEKAAPQIAELLFLKDLGIDIGDSIRVIGVAIYKRYD